MNVTRRFAVRGTGTVLAGTLAGCLGGGSSGNTVDSLPTPTMGDENAPVTVQAFEDFACPHCRTFALEDLPKLEAQYVEAGDVRYEHHDFPLPVDSRWSWKAPSAARAVQDAVGDTAFFEYAKDLYRNMEQYSFEVIGRLAEDVGADPKTVRNAAETERYRPVVEADRSLGKELGVTGTPMVFVEGTKAKDYTFETVSARIEQHIG